MDYLAYCHNLKIKFCIKFIFQIYISTIFAYVSSEKPL